MTEARECPKLKQYIEDGMAQANGESVSRAAKIQVGMAIASQLDSVETSVIEGLRIRVV